MVNTLQSGCPVAAAVDLVPGGVGRSVARQDFPERKFGPEFPILSYAQNAEDVVRNRAFADQEFGFYVDIGVCHPAETAWDVEPDCELHPALLLEVRPCDTNQRAGIRWQRAGPSNPR